MAKRYKVSNLIGSVNVHVAKVDEKRLALFPPFYGLHSMISEHLGRVLSHQVISDLIN